MLSQDDLKWGTLDDGRSESWTSFGVREEAVLNATVFTFDVLEWINGSSSLPTGISTQRSQFSPLKFRAFSCAVKYSPATVSEAWDDAQAQSCTASCSWSMASRHNSEQKSPAPLDTTNMRAVKIVSMYLKIRIT